VCCGGKCIENSDRFCCQSSCNNGVPIETRSYLWLGDGVYGQGHPEFGCEGNPCARPDCNAPGIIAGGCYTVGTQPPTRNTSNGTAYLVKDCPCGTSPVITRWKIDTFPITHTDYTVECKPLLENGMFSPLFDPAWYPNNVCK
jgi:hypothetical protein